MIIYIGLFTLCVFALLGIVEIECGWCVKYIYGHNSIMVKGRFKNKMELIQHAENAGYAGNTDGIKYKISCRPYISIDLFF